MSRKGKIAFASVDSPVETKYALKVSLEILNIRWFGEGGARVRGCRGGGGLLGKKKKKA